MITFFSEETLRSDLRRILKVEELERANKKKELAEANGIIEKEIKHIIENFENNSEINGKLSNYCYKELVGLGGSGLVFRIDKRNEDSNLDESNINKPRALKISRASLSAVDFDKKSAVQVDKEVFALSTSEHSNITRYYDHYLSQDQKYFLFITEYVETPCSISDYVAWSARKFLENSKLSASDKISATCKSLAKKLLFYGEALAYMHDTHQLYHMDIKPGNLLVSQKTDKPYVTDLGFARCKKHYAKDQSVAIGFTYGFQHPDLVNGPFNVTETLARTKSIIIAEKLGPKYDLYSFGRTILSLLYIIEDIFGNHVRCNYEFMFLHFLATLMLDGKNREGQNLGSKFLEEFAFGINTSIGAPLIIQRFSDFNNRIERLLGKYDICYDVPELHNSPESTINHGTGQLPKTQRILSIIEHPALIRLKNIKHLGVVREVYPGATHNRYAHTLGVTDYAIRFIKALYNDPHNPIFKVILTVSDVKKIILHGLIHDIAHTEFGHEFEELQKQIFDHKKIIVRILKSEWKDRKGRTLKMLIESDEYDGWQVGMGDFEAHVTMKEDDLLYIYHEIVDGRFDADKLDYLQRDARNCGVPYACGLDKKRFFSCITCLPLISTKKNTCFRLGIKEKGKVSMLKISDIRHDMYESVYLQHTARTLRAMALTACNNGLQDMIDKINEIVPKKKGKQVSNLTLHGIVTGLFLCHLSNGDISFETDQLSLFKNTQEARDGNKTIKNLFPIREIIRKTANDMCNRFVDDALTFFLGFLDDSHRRLYKDYVDRVLYKRLFERSANTIGESEIKTKFEWGQRKEHITDLETRLFDHVCHVIGNQSSDRSSLMYDEPVERINRLKREKLLLIIDTPLRKLSESKSGVYVLKDKDRKNGKLAIDQKEEKEAIYTSKMNDIIFYRILAHPDFYEILMRFVPQEEIDKIICDVFPEFR